MSTRATSGRRSTQRARLLAGMVTAANRDGYAGANVSAVIAEAGVSRPTFYEYFADRDDCFLATLTHVHTQLMADIVGAIAKEPPDRALNACVGAILAFAARQPAEAQFLMSESLSGGPAARRTRDKGIAEIERVIQAASAQAPPGALIADFPARMMIGGIYRLLSSRLRRGEPDLLGLGDDVLRWCQRYQFPFGHHRWDGEAPEPAPGHVPGPLVSPLRGPELTAPLGSRYSREASAIDHRQRILYAAALLAERKGYNATTIADITKEAGVDGRVFYATFADKQDAFMAVHELGFQLVLDVTARAFFSGASWPERIWEADRAFMRILEEEPLLAHVGFVEAHAVGPAAVQRVQDSHIAFTIFLQEGFQHRPPRLPLPSRVELELVITTAFEIVYLLARGSRQPRLSPWHGHIAFLSLAPFLGAASANQFIDEQLARDRQREERHDSEGSSPPRSPGPGRVIAPAPIV